MMSVSSVGGTPCSFARLIYTPQECPPSQPTRLVAARIRLMTSRCCGPSRSLCSWTSREKWLKQCLWNILNILTKTHFKITPNSSFDSAWITVQECATLVTDRNQLSRIFNTAHGGTLSPMHKRSVFRTHKWTVNSGLMYVYADCRVWGIIARVHWRLLILLPSDYTDGIPHFLIMLHTAVVKNGAKQFGT